MRRIVVRWSGMVGMALAATLVSGNALAARPQTARHALALAALAADAWVDDARLVWIENDSALESDGTARSWAYLFYSESLGAMRSWSVRDGTLQKPEDHSVRAAAPGLAPGWMDSAAILDVVRRHFDDPTTVETQLVSLVLVQGVFDERATWVAVFDQGDAPRLHLVLHATDGTLLRRWRG
jgi:hypothetical protein